MRYIDYGTMQSSAQRRVLDMQRRAQNAVHSTAEEPQIKPSPASGEYTSGPAEHESRSRGEECVSGKQKVSDNTDCKPALTASSPIDPEQMLLLAVLVLLLREKADTVLILAIVYLLL